MRRSKQMAAAVLALMLAFVLTACGGNANGPSGQDAGTDATATQQTGLVGKPWVTSVLQGNLPPEVPEAKNDLYTNAAYDYLAAHQMEMGGNAMTDHANELRDSVLSVIADESKTGHALEQLRLFYNQAADTNALKEIGTSEIQPYLDRIDAVTSLDEMNKLLAADDFPFSPFIVATIRSNDTQANNIVGINPNFLFSDAALLGGTIYQETDDPTAQQAAKAQISTMSLFIGYDFQAVGMDSQAVADLLPQLAEFETKHGKYLEGNGTFVKKGFGALAETARDSVFTLDEACETCANYPLRETLAKMKKDGAEYYYISRAWLKGFNDVWTEDNLEAIKLMAKAKVLAEARPYFDHSSSGEEAAQLEALMGGAELKPYKACDSLDTFAQVIAKTYVEDCLPAGTKERLTELSQQLVNTYKDLVGNTAWLGEESKQRVTEKLDNIALNVLEPDGGYFDYSELELVPTNEGGTLFSNYLRCKQYRYDYEAQMIGQPAIKAAPWFNIDPTTLNAFYEFESNSINIMPGFVTSLVYTDGMSDEDLFAGIGFTIAHEISHGFDYQGAQMDAYGRPNPIFVDEDVEKFTAKTTALADYYSSIELQPGVMANGQNLAAETCADLCGMQATLELASKSQSFDYAKFYKTMGDVWAQVIPTPMFAANAADTHPLANLRINVNAQMFDPLYSKLGVVEGDGMYLAPEKRIVVWGPNA